MLFLAVYLSDPCFSFVDVNSAHHHMDSLSEVMSQVNAIQSKLQEILHQLSDLSSSTATRQTPPNIQHCDQVCRTLV